MNITDLRGALETLASCMPDRIFVFEAGNEGTKWSDSEPGPEQGEYETVDVKALLGE